MATRKQINTLFLADSYKISHHLQYPPDTTTIFSYFESRGGKWDKTVFFGLQYILKKYLLGVVIDKEMIDEVKQRHYSGSIWDPTFSTEQAGSTSCLNMVASCLSGSGPCQRAPS